MNEENLGKHELVHLTNRKHHANMANGTFNPGLERWQEQSSSPEDRPLVSILADMLRSAQAWEEAHGKPEAADEFKCALVPRHRQRRIARGDEQSDIGY